VLVKPREKDRQQAAKKIFNLQAEAAVAPTVFHLP
jgi:hypothetical protein